LFPVERSRVTIRFPSSLHLSVHPVAALAAAAVATAVLGAGTMWVVSAWDPVLDQSAVAVTAALVVAATAAGMGWGWRRSVRAARADLEFYHRLVEDLPVGVAAVDGAHGLVVVNRQSRQRLGLAEALVTPDAFTRAVHGADIRPVDDQHQRIVDGELPYRRALRGLNTDTIAVFRPVRPVEDPTGEQVYRLQLRAGPVRDAAGAVIGAAVVNYNLTGLHEAHRQLSRHHQNTEAIASAVRAVLIRKDGPAAIITAAQTITDACVVSLFQPDGHGDLVCTACTSPEVVGYRMPTTAVSAATTCYNDGMPVWAEQVASDPRVDLATIEQLATDLGIQPTSAAWYPILSAGRCLGVLCIACPDGVPPPSTQQNNLELMASEIALALSHQDLLLELERLSGADPLTGVANRRTWQARLDREFARARREHQPLSILLIDLDHFKQYNDLHGHTAGDHHLRTVTQLWQHRLRPTDLLCRWGGEEFVVLLPECALHGAHQVAEDLRTAMPPDTTCSIGVAEWDHHESSEALVTRADSHLYDAKAAGRNRTHAH
jgi:diguanylate cyclase (GGDEF)-like protein